MPDFTHISLRHPESYFPCPSVPPRISPYWPIAAETFAETLIESNDPTLKMALCGRLNACLTLLQPTLLDPVPPHLIESLTVDILLQIPRFEPECTELCRYCLS